MNRRISVLWLLFFLLFFTLEISEAKRSFSIRTRSKSTGTQYNSRRKSNRDGSDGIGSLGTISSSGNTGTSNGHGSNSHSVPSGSSSHSVGSSVHSDHSLSNSGRLEREAVIGKQSSGINSKATAPNAGSPQNQRPVGWDVNNNKPPVGAPPPYPGLGGTSNTFNQHPPSYYQSMGNPPTYAASQAHYGVGNTYGYPNSGVQGQGSPSYSGSAYSGVNGFGSASLNGPGYAGYNGGSMAGGLSNQNPNNHGGMGTGGFNNGNRMSAYGSNYGYQKPGLFSTGNILTGLATWQVARALTPSRHHTRVQNNYYTNNGTQAVAQPNEEAPISNITAPITTITVKPEQGQQTVPTQSIKLPVPVH